MRIAALLALSAALAASDPVYVDTYALGLAHHFARQDAGLHHTTPGLGIGVAFQEAERLDVLLLGIRYRDSYGSPATGMGGGLRYTLGDRQGWHASGTAIVGVLNGSGNAGPFAAPVAGVGWRWANVEAVYCAPSVVGAWLRMSWRLP